MNKRGFFHLIIIIILLLILTGAIYLKITKSGVEIGSKSTNSSLSLNYNGALQQNTNNETPNVNSQKAEDRVSSDSISIVGR
jgi:hypothetical protein